MIPEEIGIKSTPYQHQWDCFNASKDRTAFGIFSEQGTGKCLMCLMNATYLYKAGKIKRLLIIAPKGCYRVWSDDESGKHISDSVPTKVAFWSSYQTKEVKGQLASLLGPGEALRILAINVESMTSSNAVEFAAKFISEEPTMVVVDESTTIKNPSAKRTKVVINLGRYASYRRIASGNPIPNGVLDFWSQSEFLKKNLLGYGNFYGFRNRFAVVVDQQLGKQSFKKVVGYKDLDAFKALINKHSFIIKKSDCLDLPPKVYQVIDVEMGRQQTQAYNKMAEDAFIELSKIEELGVASGSVTAEMAMVQILRLHQVSCGFMKIDETGEEVSFDEPNDRLETLMECLEQAPGKVIIWANYRYNILQIIAAISKKFGKDSVVDYYGGTSDEDRKRAKLLIQDPHSSVRFIVSNPQSGMFGNTWTRATTVVYYSNSYNLEHRDQSEDRAHRIGQVGAVHENFGLKEPSVLYLDIRVRGTVDDKIIRVLKQKKKLTDEVIASNWRWLIGKS